MVLACWVSLFNIMMGKADIKKSKLPFDQHQHKHMSESRGDDLLPNQGSGEHPSQEPSIHAIFLDLKHSLTVIDTKMDLFADIFDCLKEKLDNHDECINQLVCRTLAVEDDSSAVGENGTRGGSHLQYKRRLAVAQKKK
ncbi:hypothetical protein NDU88_006908 [Pleurodeles waltl]|uniref:Uncharacterized protein n=1 Tax=Pleurodeles waltl TaxID=8319 RepID=A0AAV7RMW7_PLEWA|nr:hypothetical protein NDU88_006908 [Pleurodeles waltl]